MKRVLALLLLVFPLAVLSAQQKYALVIGNGAYTHIVRLNNPANDARDMQAALMGLGFDVDPVINGNLVQMEAAIERFKNHLSLSRNSYGFLFYAGHGVRSGGVNYLIPVDADIRGESYLPERSVSVQAMLDELNQAGNELNIVVLDACRNNPFSWKRSSSQGLNVVGNQPADTIIVYATSAGSIAPDSKRGRNGLFTGELLKNLKTAGLEVREVFRRTYAGVQIVSKDKQRPAVYDQFGGLAYLAGRPAAATREERPIPENFVRIEGGTFTMGSPSTEVGRNNDESQHRVTVGGFYLGKYEVTQAEYEAVMGTNPSYFKEAMLPVENVSWYDAIEYCNKRSEEEGLTPAYAINKTRVDQNNRASEVSDTVRWLVIWNKNANGYRLPTEAEWEYACQAGLGSPFSTGSNITANQANYNGNNPYNNNAKGTYRGKTMEVGSFGENRWGLYDMHGNVWEWCWDWYGPYNSGARTDPIGASSGTSRVRRGGGWDGNAQGLRSASRDHGTPSYRSDYLGFRLVRP
jgi:formylglycine-generating enzyme required for sulfatase activity